MKLNLIIILCFTQLMLLNLHGSAQNQDSILKYYFFERQARFYADQNLIDSSLTNYIKAISYNENCPISVLKSALSISKKNKAANEKNLIASLIEDGKTKYNPQYAKEVNRLFKRDQKSRNGKNMKTKQRYLDCLKNKECSEREIQKYEDILNKWRIIDSTNIHNLLALISQYGYPSELIVGKKGYFRAHAILLHFDKDTGNKILAPILENALISGKLKPKEYAWIVDRRVTNQGKEPYYYHIPTANYNNLTVDQKSIIDERRIKIGLLPISKSQVVVKTRYGFKVRYIE